MHKDFTTFIAHVLHPLIVFIKVMDHFLLWEIVYWESQVLETRVFVKSRLKMVPTYANCRNPIGHYDLLVVSSILVSQEDSLFDHVDLRICKRSFCSKLL